MKIAVLMSTYNGEKYLKEQIESVMNQKGIDFELFIRDDGSNDGTCKILRSILSDHIHIQYGKNIGFRRSFITLLQQIEGFDFYAFCDQDDYWEVSKLEHAIQFMQDSCDNIPKLYYSNLKVVDENLTFVKMTKLEKRRNSLGSHIMRRSVAGCTIVINSYLRNFIMGHFISDKLLLRGHDSFLVSLCFAVNGNVYCDSNSYIKYRQHGDNVSGGAAFSCKLRFKKEFIMFRKKKYSESTMAREILNEWGSQITEECVNILDTIAYSRTSLLRRCKIFFSGRFNTGVFVLTLYGKVKGLFGII